MKIIALNYGDPSGDGHGKSATDYYKSNYPTRDIDNAVTKSCEVTGVDFSRICEDYGEDKMHEDTYDTLSKFILIDNFVDNDKFVHNYTGLYLAFAKISLPDLVTEFYPITNDELDIGGYGLFEN
jgi:hypothetical protein